VGFVTPSKRKRSSDDSSYRQISGVAVAPGDAKHHDKRIVGEKGTLRYHGTAHGAAPDQGRMEWHWYDGRDEVRAMTAFQSGLFLGSWLYYP
jgi:hypothetical protein